MEWAKVKGFNYQPSWGSTGFEIWRRFDRARMGHELSLGRLYFPGMNAIRLWLSHDAWVRDPAAFEADFEAALAMADARAMKVMPVLFNRWHDAALDYGGIYLDHFLPRASWVQGRDQPGDFARALFRAHAEDPRILAWDLCNEPLRTAVRRRRSLISSRRNTPGWSGPTPWPNYDFLQGSQGRSALFAHRLRQERL